MVRDPIDQPFSRESVSLNLVSDWAAHPVYNHSWSLMLMAMHPTQQTDAVRNESAPGHVPAQWTVIWHCCGTMLTRRLPPTLLVIACNSSSSCTAHPLYTHTDCLVGSLTKLFCLCSMLMQYIIPATDRLKLGLWPHGRQDSRGSSESMSDARMERYKH